MSIIVGWDDCDMADYFCENNPRTVMEYMAEISPDTEIPIQSCQYYKSLEFPAGDTDMESLVVRKRYHSLYSFIHHTIKHLNLKNLFSNIY